MPEIFRSQVAAALAMMFERSDLSPIFQPGGQ
jgi:hypothetical protein